MRFSLELVTKMILKLVHLQNLKEVVAKDLLRLVLSWILDKLVTKFL